jgi:hypothetical protein
VGQSTRSARNRIRQSIPPELTEPIRQELAACRQDPSRFNETILCRPAYWSRQEEICESVVRYPVTAAPAGNGVGKSHVGSGIALWFPIIHAFSRVIVAAPTNAQLTQVLWAHITAAYRSAERGGRYLGGRWDGLTLDWGDGWSLEGWGQGSIESKSGRHSGDLLAVIDEASGIKAEVLEAIDSLNPSRRLYLGNPLRAEGKFYEVCQQSENPNVNVITIPALESPHIHLRRSPWGMADATWLELSRSEYGEDSLWWLSHVLARFPGELTQTLLPASWLLAASLTVHVRSGPVRLGIDIALGLEGDDSCIVARDDTGIIESDASNRWSLEVLAERVDLIRKRLKVRGEHITYDASGVGADFGNRLKAKGIEGSKDYMGSRGGGEKFANLRSAAGWLFRRRLDPNRKLKDKTPAGLYIPQRPFSIPPSLLQRYRAELQGLRYGLGDHGEIVLEPKDDFVKRLKRSPNFLDATCMTFAYPHS